MASEAYKPILLPLLCETTVKMLEKFYYCTK